jgi:type I restriction enzyme M protein
LPPAELLEDYHKKRAALDAKIDKKLEEIQKLLGIDTIVIPDSVRGSRS